MKFRIPCIPFLSRLIPLQGSVLYADGNQILLSMGKRLEMVVGVMPNPEDAVRIVESLSTINPAMMDTFQFLNWLDETPEGELEKFAN